ncbi:MAG: hypothetical protein QME79_02810 [Bacillota bacterium]|nr:hypothetical protein [Bacillota bacterium]
MSKKATPVNGQALVEYVLVLGLISAVLGLLGRLLRTAILIAQARFSAGAALLP